MSRNTSLDKHLILRHWPPIAAIAVATTASAKKEFQANTKSLKQTGEAANRRYHRLMDHIGGLLDSIQSSGEQFIGANDLQPSTVERILYGSIHTLHLVANHGSRLLQILGNYLQLGPDLGESRARLLDGGQHFCLYIRCQRFHVRDCLAHRQIHSQENAGLQNDRDAGQKYKDRSKFVHRVCPGTRLSSPCSEGHCRSSRNSWARPFRSSLHDKPGDPLHRQRGTVPFVG